MYHIVGLSFFSVFLGGPREEERDSLNDEDEDNDSPTKEDVCLIPLQKTSFRQKAGVMRCGENEIKWG